MFMSQLPPSFLESKGTLLSEFSGVFVVDVSMILCRLDCHHVAYAPCLSVMPKPGKGPLNTYAAFDYFSIILILYKTMYLIQELFGHIGKSCSACALCMTCAFMV